MGREVAAALGLNRRGEGFIEGQNDIVTWCVGHLVELANPDVYDPALKQWRMETLPIIPDSFKYEASERTKDQFKIIKELMHRKDVTSLVNAADAGREGELIFDLVYRQAKCKKPVERLWISSLTRDAINEGFRNLQPAAAFAGLRNSAYARQQADWLVGLNATRAQTIQARRAGREGVYSLGRVQTPTLALIVGRDREIGNFVPQNYYQVVADFKADAGYYKGTWFDTKGDRFEKKEEAERIVAKVRGETGIIEKVEKKASKEKAPLLYDLTTLQRAANARYGFSAARTLEIAQSLYEKKALTYPRTASRHLSSDVHKEIRAHVFAANIGEYAQFAAPLISKSDLKLTSRHVDDKKVTDHHALIPTKQKSALDAMSDEERKVYDLVVRRFLAAFYPDAEIERTTIITIAEGESFITRGTIVLRAGWRAVDPPGREDRKTAEERNADVNGDSENDEPAGELPPVQPKSTVQNLSAEALTKQTKAPPRYSESSLLGAMETAGKQIEDEELRLAMKDSGLGTPATRASVIEVLLAREYIVRDKKSLHATAKGQTLIEMLAVHTLKSAELTGSWESKLAAMARGEYELEHFIGEIKAAVRSLVKTIASTTMEKSGGETLAREKPKDALACPKCAQNQRSGFLIERVGSKGKFLACSVGRDACGYLSDAPKNAKQRKALIETQCPSCAGALRLRLPLEKGKNAWLSCVRYPECRGGLRFDEKSVLQAPERKSGGAQSEESGPACEACGKPTVKKMAKSGNYFLACTGWRKDGTGCAAPLVWLKAQTA